MEKEQPFINNDLDEEFKLIENNEISVYDKD